MPRPDKPEGRDTTPADGDESEESGQQGVPRRILEQEPGADQPVKANDPEPFVEEDARKKAVRSMPQVPQASPVVETD